MRAIILGAGEGTRLRPLTADRPKCLVSFRGRSLLAWCRDALAAAGVTDHVVVAGYRAEAIQATGVATRLNPRFATTNMVASLFAADDCLEGDVLIVYGDVVFEPRLIRALLADPAPLAMVVNTAWRALWQHRMPDPLADAETLRMDPTGHVIDLGRKPQSYDDIQGQYTGLIRVNAALWPRIRAYHAALDRTATYDGKTFDGLWMTTFLRLLARDVEPLKGVRVDGGWIEVDSVEDLRASEALPADYPFRAPFAFGTKGATLAALAPQLTASYVLPLVRVAASAWRADRAGVTARVHAELGARRLIVRSAAATEDQHGASNAGAHRSIAGVAGGDAAALGAAVDAVLASYRRPHADDEVLIQVELAGVRLAGVLFTRELGTLAPYQVFNYDDRTGATDSVTGGHGDALRTYVRFRDATTPLPSPALEAVFRAAREVEAIAGDALELELALDADGRVCLFQARPLAVREPTAIADAAVGDWLVKAAKKVEKLSRPHPHLAGERSVFGVMPDWNPAEIIGLKPRMLALTLYKEIITDSVWAYMRDNYGYRNLRSFPLLISLLGVPYIDVRVSFNSFVPKGVREPLVARLIDHYVARLIDAPRRHDKVEFDIVFSCYYPGIKQDVARLSDAGLSDAEVGEVLAALRELTNAVIHPRRGRWIEDLAKIEELRARRIQVLESGMSTLDTVYWLIEDLKRYGTLPFSGLARAGFIAVQFLRGFVKTGVLTAAQYDAFLGSLDTVASRLKRDLAGLARGEVDRAAFLAEHGHLRPGTYDITSPRYDEAFDRYYGAAAAAAPEPPPAPFALDAATARAMADALAAEGLEGTPESVLAFCRAAIEGREYAKHVFTRSLSDALVQLEVLGRTCHVSRDDLSHLAIRTVLDRYSLLDAHDLGEILRRDIAANRAAFALTQVVRLPELILAPDDVFAFHLGDAEPNFITSRSVEAEVVHEDQLFTADLTGRIVLVRAADPGYDWIFTRRPAGLVTQFGGANSHMAIRAAEQGIPAVIGAGERNFRRWSGARRLSLDCLGRLVRVIA